MRSTDRSVMLAAMLRNAGIACAEQDNELFVLAPGSHTLCIRPVTGDDWHWQMFDVEAQEIAYGVWRRLPAERAAQMTRRFICAWADSDDS